MLLVRGDLRERLLGERRVNRIGPPRAEHGRPRMPAFGIRRIGRTPGRRCRAWSGRRASRPRAAPSRPPPACPPCTSRRAPAPTGARWSAAPDRRPATSRAPCSRCARNCQRCADCPPLLLRSLAILDVHRRADPADDGALRCRRAARRGRDASGRCRRHAGAAASIASGRPVRAGRRPMPSVPSRGRPGWTTGSQPLPDALVEGQPGVVAPLAVVEVQRAVVAGRQDHLRHGVGELPQLRLAMPQGVLDTPAPSRSRRRARAPARRDRGCARRPAASARAAPGAGGRLPWRHARSRRPRRGTDDFARRARMVSVPGDSRALRDHSSNSSAVSAASTVSGESGVPTSASGVCRRRSPDGGSLRLSCRRRRRAACPREANRRRNGTRPGSRTRHDAPRPPTVNAGCHPVASASTTAPSIVSTNHSIATNSGGAGRARRRGGCTTRSATRAGRATAPRRAGRGRSESAARLTCPCRREGNSRACRKSASCIGPPEQLCSRGLHDGQKSDARGGRTVDARGAVSLARAPRDGHSAAPCPRVARTSSARP